MMWGTDTGNTVRLHSNGQQINLGQGTTRWWHSIQLIGWKLRWTCLVCSMTCVSLIWCCTHTSESPIAPPVNAPLAQCRLTGCRYRIEIEKSTTTLQPPCSKQNSIVKNQANDDNIGEQRCLAQDGNEETDKKIKKRKAVLVPDCCNLESPCYACIHLRGKKRKGNWKEMWLLDEGMWRGRKKKDGREYESRRRKKKKWRMALEWGS